MRQRLESQHQESKGVAREFTSLSDKQGASKIYKLVGPVLLAQDKSEAVMAVQARLEFIEKEMYVFIFRFSLDWAGLGDDQKSLTLLLVTSPPWVTRLNVELLFELTGPRVVGGRRKKEKPPFFLQVWCVLAKC